MGCDVIIIEIISRVGSQFGSTTIEVTDLEVLAEIETDSSSNQGNDDRDHGRF